MVERVLGVLLLVLSLLVLPAPARADTLGWAPCAHDPALDCATVPVPVDWTAPGEGTFDLAIARRKATDPAARIGSLVINPGGPGNSGLTWLSLRSGILSPRLAARFDLVSFDPRGIGRSGPVRCSAALLAAEPHPLITSPAAFAARLAYNQARRADCRATTGPLFDHLDSVSVARDLDALRAALGDSTLTFYGASYGTLIAQHYAELFPGRIRALVLDGLMDHTLDTRRFLVEEAATVQDSFEQFLTWCGRDPACVLHGRDVRALWTRLRASGDPFELSRLAIRRLYLPAAWPDLASQLDRLERGVKDTATGLGEFPYQVFCQDFALPVRDYREYERLLRRQARAAPDLGYSTLALEQIAMCLGEPTPIANPQRPTRIDRHGPPLLLANSRHDPATAYVWAERVARQLGHRARLLTHEGSGHGVYLVSACAREIIDGYLIDPALVIPEAACVAETSTTSP